MLGTVLLCSALLGPAAELDAALARIRAVGREGAGNAEAGRAWRQLVRSGPDALTRILAGFDGADATAANWLRAAVDAIAERALAAKQPLPATQLEAFLLQRQHNAAARRLAYEWLVRVDPAAPDRLLPGMLHDPSAELRRDAVARVLDEAERKLRRGDRAGATAAYRKAFSGACDRDQVDQIANQLRALGPGVDLAAHFGFLQHWLLIGPFDNTGGAGFSKRFPPERGVDLAATCTGKGGAAIHWAAYRTPDPYGLVDLNKAIGKHAGAVAYAFAAVSVPAGLPVQIRAGSDNAIQVFLNGKLIFSREEYHHGMQMDQHLASCTFQPGRNEILVKVCQNEQTDDWAQIWSFQLRICDAVGEAVPFTLLGAKAGVRPPGAKGER